MEKILIVRLGSMGDIVHGLPAVAAIRRLQPQTVIGWVLEEYWADLISTRECRDIAGLSPQKPLVDRLHLVNTKQWRKSLLVSSSNMEQVRKMIRQGEYDTVIDFQGSMKSGLITRLSGVKTRVGFDSPREAPARWFYTHRVEATSPHVIGQNAELAAAVVGAPITIERTGFDVLPHDPIAEKWVDDELSMRGLKPRGFALFNPGAGWRAKEWPADRFGTLARSLSNDGLPTLLNVGPNEAEMGSIIERLSGGAAKPISCSMRKLIALTRRAAVMIGGDTGPMHLANLLGVPVVALFGPTDPIRNGPYYQPSIVLRSDRSTISYSHRDVVDEGLVSITVEQVLNATRDLRSTT